MTNSTYFMHGTAVESNINFPGFQRQTTGKAEIAITRALSSLAAPEDSPKGHLIVEGIYEGPGNTERAFYMHGFRSHYVLSWENLCDFLVLRDGSRIECHPSADVPWSDIRQFLLGRVLPLALNLRDVVTLHGGGVLMPKGAVAFVATSGVGKSTLISALNSIGHRIITDDVIAIREVGEEFRMFFGPPQVRLTQESLDRMMPHISAVEPDYDKYRVTLPGESRKNQVTGAPLEAVYMLKRSQDHDSPICISTLPSLEALPTLLRNTTNLQLLEGLQVKQQFLILSRLVGRVPIKVLEFPSNFESIPDVCTAILEAQGECLYPVAAPA